MTHRDGWRYLAEMLRGLREARWARLPPDATAERVWSRFRDAVVAAADEAVLDLEKRFEEGEEEKEPAESSGDDREDAPDRADPPAT